MFRKQIKIKKIGFGIVFLLFVFIFLQNNQEVYAIQINIPPQADTSLDSDPGYESYNYGNSDYGFVSSDAAMLLVFDLSNIPAGSTINTGIIRLTKLNRA